MTVAILMAFAAALYLDMGLGALVMLSNAACPRKVGAFLVVLFWPLVLAGVMPTLAVMAWRTARRDKR